LSSISKILRMFHKFYYFKVPHSRILTKFTQEGTYTYLLSMLSADDNQLDAYKQVFSRQYTEAVLLIHDRHATIKD